MVPTGKDYAFFYGTLRQGETRDAFGGAVVMGEAYIDGYQLFDLGSFPTVQPGEGIVRGEVHQLDASMLRLVDRIEGYNSAKPDQGLYNRVQVEAYDLEGTKQQCWVYVLNNPTNRPLKLIPSGDWFTHKGLY